MSMKQHVERLVSLNEVTNKEDFAKIPSGYAKRERACLIQMCLHPNKVVRQAAAELPLLRDMFVIAMFEQEEDPKVKRILQPKFEAACSKRDQYDNTVALQATEIKNLRTQLKQLKKG